MPNSTSSSTPSVGLGTINPLGVSRATILDDYHLFGTPSEPVFDELVELARLLCGTSGAIITLLGEERQWAKAQAGPLVMGSESLRNLPVAHSFCQATSQAKGLVEIPDAHLDPTFANHPLVTAKPHLRFYAGVPLLTAEGYPLGTLCVLDSQPRRLSEAQREGLLLLGRQVMTHFELRRVRVELSNERRALEGALRLGAAGPAALGPPSARPEIFVKQEQRLVRIPAAEIRYVEALGDYVNIYTERERLTVYTTMKEMELRLPALDFARIHRKYIVRLDCIVSLESDVAQLESSRGQGLSLVPIGNSYKSALLNRLNVV